MFTKLFVPALAEIIIETADIAGPMTVAALAAIRIHAVLIDIDISLIFPIGALEADLGK